MIDWLTSYTTHSSDLFGYFQLPNLKQVEQSFQVHKPEQRLTWLTTTSPEAFFGFVLLMTWHEKTKRTSETWAHAGCMGGREEAHPCKQREFCQHNYVHSSSASVHALSLSLSTTHLASKSSVWGFLPLTSK